MSADGLAPPREMPPPRSRVVKSNGTQIILFTIPTVILTAATVWGGRVWLRNSETLVLRLPMPTVRRRASPQDLLPC